MRSESVLKSMYQRLPKRAQMVIQAFRYPKNSFIMGPLTYNENGLATVTNCDFIKDPRFMQSYAAGKRTGSWGLNEIHWRIYVACWAANWAKNLPGDFVECGVNKGGLSLAAMNYINFKNISKKFYLLDTFEGLSEKYSTNEELLCNSIYKYCDCYLEVKETFKEYPNVEIIKGVIPDTLPLVKAKEISFLSIDMNCVIPEIAAAEFFWEKMVHGAVIVLDDYGWAPHTKQKDAFDKFSEQRNAQVLSLPTGQGLIFKPKLSKKAGE